MDENKSIEDVMEAAIEKNLKAGFLIICGYNAEGEPILSLTDLGMEVLATGRIDN